MPVPCRSTGGSNCLSTMSWYAGHLNHSLFWKSLCPTKEYEPPSGDLSAALEKQFGGLEGLKKQFNPAAAGIQVGHQPKSKPFT